MISNASCSDVFWNLNKADLGLFILSIPIGFIAGKSAVKFHYGNEYVRRRLFSAVFSYVMFVGGFMAMNNSSYRLAGLVDNGL